MTACSRSDTAVTFVPQQRNNASYFSDSNQCWRANERHAMLLHLDFSKSGAADSQLFGSCTPLRGQSPLHSEKFRDPVLPRIN
jgi:hypothetical protein